PANAGCPLRPPRLLPARDSPGLPGRFCPLPGRAQGDSVATRELTPREPMKILNVVGTRPNLVKIAPLMAEMNCQPEIRPILVHTGQHYREAMSDQFFSELGIRQPDFDLGVGSGPHAAQTAE